MSLTCDLCNLKLQGTQNTQDTRHLCEGCGRLLMGLETDNPIKKSTLFEREPFGGFSDVLFQFSAPQPVAPRELLVGIIGVDAVSHFTKSGFHRTAFSLLADALKELSDRISRKKFRGDPKWKGILVAPEFFFHRSEPSKQKQEVDRLPIDSSILPHRCLDEDTRDLLIQACKALSIQYPSILIVPGSFLYRKSLNPKRRKKATSTVSGIEEVLRKKDIWTIEAETRSKHFVGHSATGEIDNDFVKVGGKLTRDSIEKTLSKINQYDYMLRNTVYGFYRGQVVLKYHKVGLNADIEPLDDNRTRTVFVSGGGARIVKFNGVRIGVEICLDHNLGVLKKLEPGKTVDLHLIVSGSVDNEEKHYCHSASGFVIHADTNPNTPA